VIFVVVLQDLDGPGAVRARRTLRGTGRADRLADPVVPIHSPRSGQGNLQREALTIWSFNPQIPKALILDLATIRFIREHGGLLLLGPLGTGKSHIALSLTVAAIQAGYTALYRSAFDLAQDLAEAEATGTRPELIRRLTRVDLLVIEDLGMRRLAPTYLEHCHNLLTVSQRHGILALTLVKYPALATRVGCVPDQTAGEGRGGGRHPPLHIGSCPTLGADQPRGAARLNSAGGSLLFGAVRIYGAGVQGTGGIRDCAHVHS
jgi:hypothetical protein